MASKPKRPFLVLFLHRIFKISVRWFCLEKSIESLRDVWNEKFSEFFFRFNLIKTFSSLDFFSWIFFIRWRHFAFIQFLYSAHFFQSFFEYFTTLNNFVFPCICTRCPFVEKNIFWSISKWFKWSQCWHY